MSVTTFINSSLPNDVEVILGNSVLHLNSILLRSFSKVFDASMSDKWWGEGTTSTAEKSQNTTIRYKYRLVQESNGDWELLPAHKIPETDSNQKPPESIVRSYTSFFEAIHQRLSPLRWVHYPGEYESFIKLVDFYDAYMCISSQLEAFAANSLLLLKSGREKNLLSTQLEIISSAIKISIKIKSESLYKESFMLLIDEIPYARSPGAIIGVVPDFVAARAYKAAYENTCPNHGKGKKLFPNCNCDLAGKFATKYPWENKTED